MYLFWFFEFVFNVLILEPLRILGSVFNSVVLAFSALGRLISVFPSWLSVAFMSLISIAVLFRVSQFIPTIGGASNN